MQHTQAHLADSNQDAQSSIDLHYYFALLRRYQWQILGLSAAISLLTFLVLLSVTPVYQASASILIHSEEVTAVSVGEVVGVDYKRQSYYSTQYEILKSREIATIVVDRLNLSQHPSFDARQAKQAFSFTALLGLGDNSKPEFSDEQLRSIAISKVKGGISVTPLNNTQIAIVSFSSTDRKVAAVIANAIADAYIENHLASKLEMTQKASNWLKVRLEDLKERLLESEVALQNFKEKEQLIDVTGIKSIKADELEQLAGKLIEIRQKKSRIQNTYEQIESLKGQPIDEIVAVSAIIQQPLIQSLKAQENESAIKTAELAKRYGQKHPRMIAAQSELKNAQLRLQQQVFNSIGALKKEYEILTEFEKSLQKQNSTARKEYQALERKTFKLDTLKREVDSNRNLYDLFLTRAKETVEASGFSVAHARILEPAQTPSAPIKPKKNLILLAAIILSLGLGIALVLAYDILDNTVKTPADVEAKLKTPMLGLLPLIKHNNDSVNAFTGFIDDKKSAFAEAIRTIRTGVLLSSLDDDKRVLVVTSSIPNEGKSTLSINLASALGQMQKTLLIDADMRRPTLAKTFNINTQHKGLSQLVAGTASLEECVISLDENHFDLLTAGLVPPNPLELLSSQRFKQLITDLGDTYDHIIIDSPPTQSVSDSLILSTIATGVVYVVKADATNSNLVNQGLARLHKANAHILGIALNQVNISKSSGYQYDYLSGYYDADGYSQN